MKCLTLPLLLVLFVGLKLAGIIGWSWWWVVAPLWVPAAVAFLLVVVELIVAWLLDYI